jgi:hypothetical protein
MTLHESNDIPVPIDPVLMEALTPNSYLSSMGITREQRETNIRRLANAVIKPAAVSGDFQTQIQFMVAKGPYIKEEFLTVNVSFKDNDGTAAIVLSLATEPGE